MKPKITTRVGTASRKPCKANRAWADLIRPFRPFPVSVTSANARTPARVAGSHDAALWEVARPPVESRVARVNGAAPRGPLSHLLLAPDGIRDGKAQFLDEIVHALCDSLTGVLRGASPL